ncbi:hypothetical protein R1flu_027035 [Riccia fluitans]|uniref:Uncharacterized protein n=1 Tax=Riccia fluitans TaxID=41844 RepID=A0ABD1XHP9_9MARC
MNGSTEQAGRKVESPSRQKRQEGGGAGRGEGREEASLVLVERGGGKGKRERSVFFGCRVVLSSPPPLGRGKRKQGYQEMEMIPWRYRKNFAGKSYSVPSIENQWLNAVAATDEGRKRGGARVQRTTS